jgi:hypothetical protein
MRDGFSQEQNSRRHHIAAGRQTIADVARGSSRYGIAAGSVDLASAVFHHIRPLASLR